MNYEMNEPVLLNYTKNDLHSEDLGASGIVLDSIFKDFKYILDDTFVYFGTIKENEEWCVIYRKTYDNIRGREYAVLKTMIKKHTDYEKVGNHWFSK